MPSDDFNRSVLIVGAGVFGLSTALHLLQRGWKDVTIIDKSSMLPAPDAASTDINKVVRSCYSDLVYTRLAVEAIAAWKNRDEWADTYHESGVLLPGKNAYAELSLYNDTEAGADIKLLHSSEDLRTCIPPQIPLGQLYTQGFKGYINYDGGWANAEQGVRIALDKVRRLGARIEPGRSAVGLSPDGRGVMLEDGNIMTADFIVIATGAWTASSFPDLRLKDQIVATGQSTASIQLSADDAHKYRNVPVIVDYSTGFYVFPPNQSNVMKFSIHAFGYTNPQGEADISTPRTHVSHPDGGTIPREVAGDLRTYLASIYPELGTRPFASTRMCWRPGIVTLLASSLDKVKDIMSHTGLAFGIDSDWLIDYHPEHPSVLLATGGSGHAYKFLPVVGRLVADRLENKLDADLAKKFSFVRVSDSISDASRQLQPRKHLDPSQLHMDVDEGHVEVATN